MRPSWLVSALAMTCPLLPNTAVGEGVVMYCVEEHVTGLAYHEGKWVPAYSGRDDAERYTISIEDDFSVVSGVAGTDTPYLCHHGFPNKAPEVVTCINTRVVTMVFNYNTETSRFQLTQVSPGGWLSVGTEREEEIGLLADHLTFGKCQAF